MRPRIVVGSLVLAGLTAACGIRDQSEPSVVAAKDVPFGLVSRPLRSSLGDSSLQPVSLYFLGRNGLVKVERSIDGEATPARALRELLAGPDDSERAAGAASVLVSSSAARFTHTRDGVAQVALASGFRDSAIGNQPAALAEIVYTLTAFSDVDQVHFVVDGEPVAVPTPDGSLAEGPVDRSDYAELGARADVGQ